jgi:hypothetical protein
VPALQAARDLAKSPEGRRAFDDLIARVDARSLDRPTMVALDVVDKTLGEAVEMLATRSGFDLALDDPTLASRRVSVPASGPLPFWRALDRLGRAGHIRHDPGPRSDAMGIATSASTIRLVAGDPSAFTSYFGPLRFHLFATHRHRDMSFAVTNGSDGRHKSATVTVEIQAFAEPGRFINPNGPPRLQAVDERGRMFAQEPGGAANQPEPVESSWLFPGRLPLLHWQVPLGLPDRPAGSTIKLRGVLPVVLTARNRDPWVIPLAGADGKSFRQGASIVRVSRVSGTSLSHQTVDFFLKEEAGSTDRSGLSVRADKDYIGDYLRDRIEFVDAQGRPVPWILAYRHPAPNANGEFQIQALVHGAPPAHLRIYRLSRLAIEAPFEFNDVASPF